MSALQLDLKSRGFSGSAEDNQRIPQNPPMRASPMR
jgi:hypothetical protein